MCLFSEFLLFDPLKMIKLDGIYKYSVRITHRIVRFYRNDQSVKAA